MDEYDKIWVRSLVDQKLEEGLLTEKQAFIREAAMRAMQGMGVNYVHTFEKCDAQACVMAAELLWQALQESEKK